MRKQLIILVLLLAFCHTVYPQQELDPKKSDAIGKALSELVSKDKAPGMIAAIISGDGIIAMGSAGVRKMGSDIPLTYNDLFYLASCTKAMTSTMIATLVAERKLDWETKLIDAIPELRKSIHPDYQSIILWQLLTHRAGLLSNPVNWWAYPTKEIKARRLAIIQLALPPVHPSNCQERRQ